MERTENRRTIRAIKNAGNEYFDGNAHKSATTEDALFDRVLSHLQERGRAWDMDDVVTALAEVESLHETLAQKGIMQPGQDIAANEVVYNLLGRFIDHLTSK